MHNATCTIALYVYIIHKYDSHYHNSIQLKRGIEFFILVRNSFFAELLCSVADFIYIKLIYNVFPGSGERSS